MKLKNTYFLFILIILSGCSPLSQSISKFQTPKTTSSESAMLNSTQTQNSSNTIEMPPVLITENNRTITDNNNNENISLISDLNEEELLNLKRSHTTEHIMELQDNLQNINLKTLNEDDKISIVFTIKSGLTREDKRKIQDNVQIVLSTIENFGSSKILKIILKDTSREQENLNLLLNNLVSASIVILK
jgi:hypothetical protein